MRVENERSRDAADLPTGSANADIRWCLFRGTGESSLWDWNLGSGRALVDRQHGADFCRRKGVDGVNLKVHNAGSIKPAT